MELDAYLSDKHKKRKKRRRYGYAIGAVVLFTLIFTGAAWLVFRSSLLRIKNISVEGNNVVPADSVTALLESSVLRDHDFWKSLLGINNMLIWPDALATSDLKLIPQLASVAITKDYFSRAITAEVVERTPFGIWCFVGGGSGSAGAAPAAGIGAGAVSAANAAASNTAATPPAITENENCYWFDGQGILFGRTFDTQGGLLSAVHDYSQEDQGLNGTILPAEFIPNLISIMNVLKESGIKASEIALKDIGLQQINVTTYNGPALYFSLRFPADEDLAVLQNLMAKPVFAKLQYVDFTVQNRAYYK